MLPSNYQLPGAPISTNSTSRRIRLLKASNNAADLYRKETQKRVKAQDFDKVAITEISSHERINLQNKS